MNKMLDLVVTENTTLSDSYCLIKLTTADQSKLPEMKPGQFVQVRVDNSATTYLRRPISINYVNKETNEVLLLVQMIGDGTRAMGQYKKGDVVNLLLPLGNTFITPKCKDKPVLLVGGGVGIAPMLFLGSELKKQGYTINFLLGARSKKDLLQLEEFIKYGEVFTTTEDASHGEKGYVTDHSVLSNPDFDSIYTCGPKPMMQAVAKYAYQHNINCEVSLENMMACGFGACLCCVEKTVRGNVCVCTEGPVFNIKDLTWKN